MKDKMKIFIDIIIIVMGPIISYGLEYLNGNLQGFPPLLPALLLCFIPFVITLVITKFVKNIYFGIALSVIVTEMVFVFIIIYILFYSGQPDPEINGKIELLHIISVFLAKTFALALLTSIGVARLNKRYINAKNITKADISNPSSPDR